ncbi:MAG: uracil-DNA glycosylase [candidate division WOR-3 bacterium]
MNQIIFLLIDDNLNTTALMDQKEFSTQATYLINLCDCISIGNKGEDLVLRVFNKYPYANTYMERNATTKSIPGTIQIKGDGHQNRYVINFYAQFYPGPPFFPSDDISKRCEWFNQCLTKLMDIKEIKSLAFPQDIGLYPKINFRSKYLEMIDDFQKRYYLKHCVNIQIVNYCDQPINLDSQQLSTNQDQAIKILQVPQISQNNQSINVVKHIKIEQLVYVHKSSMSTSFEVKLSSETVGDQKNKISIKRKMLPVTSTSESPTTSPPSVVTPTTSLPSVVTPTTSPPSVVTPTTSLPSVVTPSTSPPSVVTPTTSTSSLSNGELQLRPYDKNPTWTKHISQLINELDSSWNHIFAHNDLKSLINQLDLDFVKEMNTFGDFIEVLPIPQDNIFNAFKLSKFPIKVVIVGQDCYAEHLNQAMGLSFSVQDGVAIPPSLDNIFKELENDIPSFKIPKSGNLTKWAQQGVLLLNSSLTVRYQKKESHMKIWKPFTDKLIELISQFNPNPVVFMLWGNYAKSKKELIKQPNSSTPFHHLILNAAHPSPLSASRGWFGCRHFSQCNDFLQKHGLQPIDWQLSVSN